MPPLGFVRVQDRSQAQHDAHAQAVRGMVRHALPSRQLRAGQKACLFDFWKDPRVIADVGRPFSRKHQLTGSCVDAGGWNALISTIAAQRCSPTSPTKAFIPFTYHNYAMSRHYMGDDSQGEGSLGSTFAQSLNKDGVRDWDASAGLPQYTESESEGVVTSESVEMAWSSIRNSGIQAVLNVAKDHLVGSAAECKNVADIRAMTLNGYGVSFACNNYIGNARVQGDVVVGHWDESGGHQQSVHAYFEHPTLGPLYWAQNSWGADTYPRDPSGGPICGCWVTEANVEAAFRMDAEVYGLSHLAWFPSTPDLFSWD